MLYPPNAFALSPFDSEIGRHGENILPALDLNGFPQRSVGDQGAKITRAMLGKVAGLPLPSKLK